MDLKDAPMVKVTWVDAQESNAGWQSLDEMQAAPLAKCQEIGVLIVNDYEKVVVCRSRVIDDGFAEEFEDMGGACIAIPKSWVVRIDRLACVGSLQESSGSFEGLASTFACPDGSDL
jgi:hypothetical protein